MEKSNSQRLKLVVYLLLGILALQLGMLAYIFYPGKFFLWMTLGVIFIVCIYLAVLSLRLIHLAKEFIDKD